MGRSALKGDLDMTRLIALGKSYQLHKTHTKSGQSTSYSSIGGIAVPKGLHS